MFEVIVTYRPDFSEKIVDRYPTYDAAQDVALRITAHRYERVVRVWVRQIRESNMRT